MEENERGESKEKYSEEDGNVNSQSVTSKQESSSKAEIAEEEDVQVLPPSIKLEPSPQQLFAETSNPEVTESEREEYVPNAEFIRDEELIERKEESSNENCLFAEDVQENITLAGERLFTLTHPMYVKDSSVASTEIDTSCSTTISGGDVKDKQSQETPSYLANPVNKRCHNLSISELRRKLSYCPICQVQYSNHRLAKMCLVKHGKRQCWLCLDILSSTKEDFYRHCMDFHSVSSTGDIVACPFCGKFFDFRQGLNQHIVKIHFSESISDLDAVAALSPTTLVDIFTGRPRLSSPSLDNSQNQIDSLSELHELSKCTNMTTLTTLTRQESRISNANMSISSSNSLIGRPSVITLSSGKQVEKMKVPPEQALSSLAEELGFTAFNITQSQIPDQCGENRSRKMIENTSLKIQPDYPSLNYVSRNPCAYFPSSSSAPDIIPPTSKQFDTTSSINTGEEKVEEIPWDASESVGDEMKRTYEKVITRVNSNIFEEMPIFGGSPTDAINEQGGNDSSSASVLGDEKEGYQFAKIQNLPEFEFNDPTNLEMPTRHNEVSAFVRVSTDRSEISHDMQTIGKRSTGQEIGITDPTTNFIGRLVYPDKCGVKRRILMKAMWDEQNQFKKPNEQGIQETISLLPPKPISSSIPMPSSALGDQMQNSWTYNEENMLLLKGRNPHQAQTHNHPAMMTQGQVVKNVGRFFEQYVRESRQGDPTKLFNFLRPETGLNEQNNLRMNSGWNNNSSSKTSSGGSWINLGQSMFEGRAPPSCSQWQCQSPTSALSRPQFPSPRQMMIRKAPNPAFWDNLRARLLTQHARKLEATRAPINIASHAASPQESILVQNPFEEEANSQAKYGTIGANLISTSSRQFNLEVSRLPGRSHLTSQQQVNPLILGSSFPQHNLQSETEPIKHHHQLCPPFTVSNSVANPSYLSHPECASSYAIDQGHSETQRGIPTFQSPTHRFLQQYR